MVPGASLSTKKEKRRGKKNAVPAWLLHPLPPGTKGKKDGEKQVCLSREGAERLRGGKKEGRGLAP